MTPMNTTIRTLLIANTVAVNLMAGLLFSFSTCVMPALRRLPVQFSLTAIQTINRFIINPVFVAIFLGSTGCSIGLLANRFRSADDVPAQALVGSVIYLVGFLLVTVTIHLPLNAMIAGLQIESAPDAQRWSDITNRWTRFNHVRTLAALVAGGLLGWALW